MDRRSFIRRAAIGLAALAVAPAVFVREHAKPDLMARMKPFYTWNRSMHTRNVYSNIVAEKTGSRVAAIEVQAYEERMSEMQRKALLDSYNWVIKHPQDVILYPGGRII